jgi:predicted aldo/keto reductase-like oxidoreductase
LGISSINLIVTMEHIYTPVTFDEYFAVSHAMLVYIFHGITGELLETMKGNGAVEHARKRQAEDLFTYLGFSSHNGHEMIIYEAIESGVFQVCERPYNVFATGFQNEAGVYGNLLKKAHEARMAVINMKAFAGTGMFAGNRLLQKD